MTEVTQSPTNNEDAIADSPTKKQLLMLERITQKGGTYYKAIVSDSGEVTYEAIGGSENKSAETVLPKSRNPDVSGFLLFGTMRF